MNLNTTEYLRHFDKHEQGTRLAHDPQTLLHRPATAVHHHTPSRRCLARRRRPSLFRPKARGYPRIPAAAADTAAAAAAAESASFSDTNLTYLVHCTKYTYVFAPYDSSTYEPRETNVPRLRQRVPPYIRQAGAAGPDNAAKRASGRGCAWWWWWWLVVGGTHLAKRSRERQSPTAPTGAGTQLGRASQRLRISVSYRPPDATASNPVRECPI